MDKLIDELTDNLMAVIQKASDSENRAMEFYPGELLSRSEIHIIDLIGRTSHAHVSEIARRFGVTKGAASQLIKKLDRKGFVEKSRDPENHTRTLIALSGKGRVAFDNHRAYHRERDGDFFLFLEKRSGEELDLFNDFLKEFLKMYP